MLAKSHAQYIAASFAFVTLIYAGTPAQAQPDAVANELKRFNGHWRVVEMVENGRAIPEDQMRRWLPGGGVLEIVDYTILFKSPMDGTKSTKTFRLDPTSYPKAILIMQQDSTTGTGIYKFDQGKLVICITNEAGQIPTEFNARTDSKRTLIVMESFDAGTSEIPGLNSRLPARKPVQIPARSNLPKNDVAKPAKAPTPPPAPLPQPQVTPPLVVAERITPRILTDAEVRNLALGTWRINDNEGSVDIVFDASGRFQTYRYFRMLTNFQTVFTPTPISSGTWRITSGRLIANVTTSSRLDKVNQSFVPAVRSISATDMILVDHLGRVSRAVRTR